MSAGLRFLEGAMRASAASLRGYMEARVAVAKATNDRELQKAQNALVAERNKLLKQKQQNDFVLGKMKIGSDEQMHKEAQETARIQIVTDHEGNMYKVDKETGSAVEIAKVQAEAAQGVAETGAGAQVKSAEIGAGAQVDTAKIGAESAKDVATIQGQTQENVATTGAEASKAVAQTGADAQTESARIAAEASQAVAEINAQYKNAGSGMLSDPDLFGKTSKLREVLSRAGIKPDEVPLTQEQLDTKMTISQRLNTDKLYTYAMDIQAGYLTALGGYREQGGFGDISMVVGLVKIQDPGSVAREGEVALVQRAQDMLGRFKTQFTADQLASGAYRDQLMQMILDQYNLRAGQYGEQLRAKYGAMLNAGVLAGSGLTYESIGNPLYRDPRTIQQLLDVQTHPDDVLFQAGSQAGEQGGQGGTQGGQQDGLGGDGRMTQDGGQGDQAGAGGTDKVSQTVARAKQLFDGGTSPAAIRAGIVTAMTNGGVSPEEQQQTLQQVASAIGVDPQAFAAGTGDFAEASPNGGGSGEGAADAETQTLVAEREAELVERARKQLESGSKQSSVRRYVRSRLMDRTLKLSTEQQNEIYERIMAQVLGGQ